MPDYVKKLGLSHDPFIATARYRSFFTGAKRELLLEQLLEQAHYGAPISIVRGALGSGRSTLAKEFQKSFSEEACCIRVQATLFMNQGQFLDALLEQLPVGASSPEVADIVQDLCQFAERLYLDARTLVLIIDDAHELASDVLKIIDALTASTTEGAVHVLLLGERQLTNMLGNVLGERALGRVIEEELATFSADDACAYVRLKLDDAGYNGEIPVDTAEIGALCNEAGGVPGSFNIAFAQELEQSLKKPGTVIAKPENGKGMLELGAPYWATAAVLLVFLLVLLVFTSPESVTTEVASSEGQAVTTRIELPISANDPVDADVPTAATNSTEQIEESLPAQIPAEQLDDEVLDAIVGTETLVAIDGESASTVVSAPVSEPAINNEENAGPAASILLSYPAENFTVQIMGSRSEENVQRFIEQQLAAFNAQYFQTRHQERPWYVVVMGNFVSRDVASRAISDLPASIRRMDPFIRQLGDVQADIRKYQTSD